MKETVLVKLYSQNVGEPEIIAIQEKECYEFRVLLETPYKWGEGYSKASAEDVEQNLKDINSLKDFLKGNFKVQEKEHFGGCPSWWNSLDDVEEIYVHPMELSGVLRGENIIRLQKALRESNFPVTKFLEIRVFGTVKSYQPEELIHEFEEKLPEVLPIVYKKYGDCVPLNFDFRKYFGFKFKQFTFVKDSHFNKVQDNQERLMLRWLLSELKRYNEKKAR